MAQTKVEVEVEGRRLVLSNLDKVLYPAAHFTKAEVIDYYTRVAPVLLPHLKDRPLTLKRYPNGVDAPFFYEKQAPSHRPPWVKTVAIYSDSNDRDIDYVVCNDLPTLVWLANLADLELHTTMAKAKTPHQPTMVVFDLDPGPPANLHQCCVVGLRLRELLRDNGLDSYAKVSGSKGLQVYVPLNAPRVTYDVTTPFAKEVAVRMEKDDPALVVSKQKKELRVGKVLVDWSQNVDSKTTVCVYSLRARERPTVAMPVTWDEVAECADSGDLRPMTFEAGEALDRVAEAGDLFAPVLTTKQKLPATLR
ncbi:MAG: bifunctional non-ous end joining protein LigD [Frankiaceae bacterium]|jgi:bifunctional non-homologous end joining protein LigD|nr:bifunctional non-ous end joining protein LigD [Frankiaceae bacterium]